MDHPPYDMMRMRYKNSITWTESWRCSSQLNIAHVTKHKNYKEEIKQVSAVQVQIPWRQSSPVESST